MIRFEPVDEPAAFEASVAEPGRRWLIENPSGRPPATWGRFQGDLADGFGNLCAYSAMYEPVGTVDHFVSLAEDRSRAYDWSNYRFASAWINSSKGDVSTARLLDPYEVTDGWFEILLPSLQLVVADAIPEALRDRAEFVLERLHLRDDERVLRQRREWYRMYTAGELSLKGLAEKAPLIARAVERQRNAVDTK